MVPLSPVVLEVMPDPLVLAQAEVKRVRVSGFAPAEELPTLAAARVLPIPLLPALLLRGGLVRVADHQLHVLIPPKSPGSGRVIV
jgi:hypothetical protein